MKPFFQKLAPLPEESIIFLDEEIPHFIVPWHFHPEIEILYVVKSTGTSYIGDSINNFCEGEISIIGENMPHWWKSDPHFLEKTDTLNNRTKRVFSDPVGKRCGAHELPFLLQTYRRDTGEIMHDISAPVYVKGRHWGGFRMGYRTE